VSATKKVIRPEENAMLKGDDGDGFHSLVMGNIVTTFLKKRGEGGQDQRRRPAL